MLFSTVLIGGVERDEREDDEREDEEREDEEREDDEREEVESSNVLIGGDDREERFDNDEMVFVNFFTVFVRGKRFDNSRRLED